MKNYGKQLAIEIKSTMKISDACAFAIERDVNALLSRSLKLDAWIKYPPMKIEKDIDELEKEIEKKESKRKKTKAAEKIKYHAKKIKNKASEDTTELAVLRIEIKELMKDHFEGRFYTASTLKKMERIKYLESVLLKKTP
jgi:hypothetical protein